MLVKIGNNLYNSEEQPIMLILNTHDKDNISNMNEQEIKYCCYPEKMKIEDVIKFMKELEI